MLAGRGFDLTTMDTCCDSKADLPRISFLDEPLAQFAQSLDDCLHPDEPGMRRWDSFADVLEKVDGGRHKVDRHRLPEGKVRRSEVFELAAANPEVSVATICAAAMAWGGMNLENWRLLWGPSDREWLNVAQCIRDGNLTRAEAYERLRVLKKKGDLKGMGPAYFTKLIYFLTPRDKPERQTAYIMDQWAASSVNLLTGWNMVLMDVTPKSPRRTRKSSMSELALSFTFTVSDKNTAVDYEAFCSAVDQLACRFCLCTDQIDQALFSSDVIGPGCWRRHVIHHRLQLPR